MPSKPKKRKQFIIMYASFAVVLAALVLYLVLRSPNRIQYGLPELPAVSADEIDTVTVSSEANGELKLQRENSSWVIMPEGYKADATAVNQMLNAITDLKLTDLVSTSGHFDRYELNDENKLIVTASGGGKQLISFDLGKRAPSYNHTYISVGDGQVYQAATDLRRVFDKNAESIRNRLVLSFSKDEIVRIDAVLPGAEYTLTKTSPDVSAGNTAASAVTWQTPDGNIWETEIVNDFLDRLDNLTCTSYADTPAADDVEPLITLKLKGMSEYDFKLLAKEENNYLASSSQTAYEFYISTYQGDNILETFSQLKTGD